jgi:hypothetical protein
LKHHRRNNPANTTSIDGQNSDVVRHDRVSFTIDKVIAQCFAYARENKARLDQLKNVSLLLCLCCTSQCTISGRANRPENQCASTSLIPSLSPSIVPAKRAVRELVRLSRTSIAGEMGEAHTRRTVG